MNDWRPTAELSALRRRADLYRKIRDFFAARGVLEVDTPLLAAHGVTEPNIACIEVAGHGWLQSSPEYHMKRLLAAGSGPIYQICRAFRDGEQGRRHNREFTLLEWYRPDFSLAQLMDECEALLTPLLGTCATHRHRFRDIFREQTGVDPLSGNLADLRDTAEHQHGPLPDLDRAALVDLLMATRVEPGLPRDQLIFIEDFPGWAAALARTREDHDRQQVAQRFEIYAGGLELANGYLELLDADEQALRFDNELMRRRQQGLPNMLPDPWLLDALRHGLPACSGVAVGLERVLMVMLGASEIGRVMAFTQQNA